jgi:hypothetical protein
MIMSNETERTLHELKLPGMASCWSSLEETHQLDKLTLREGMQIMLQYERDTRGNNRIQLQGDYGAFGSLLCGESKRYIT